MYLISIYFDEQTNKQVQRYMNQVAMKSGNTFMLDGNVPPHITISAFETRQEEQVITHLEKLSVRMKAGTLRWVSVGMFLPYVLYIAPVLNEYLHGLSVQTYEMLSQVEDIRIRTCYQPFQWMPHTTIGKKMTKEEIKLATEVMQSQFGVFSGQVVKIGLSKTNPYEDIVVFDLM